MPIWAEIAMGIPLGVMGAMILFWVAASLGGPSWQEVCDYLGDALSGVRHERRIYMQAAGVALVASARLSAAGRSRDYALGIHDATEAITGALMAGHYRRADDHGQEVG